MRGSVRGNGRSPKEVSVHRPERANTSHGLRRLSEHGPNILIFSIRLSASSPKPLAPQSTAPWYQA